MWLSAASGFELEEVEKNEFKRFSGVEWGSSSIGTQLSECGVKKLKFDRSDCVVWIYNIYVIVTNDCRK
jgi:hypothetical protein